mgnify:FL=1
MKIRILLAAVAVVAAAVAGWARDARGAQGEAQNEGFRAEEVTVRSGGVTLGGTLTRPEGTPKAALVLASGSGAQDRDEEVLGHRPFKAIAEYLAGKGYAVIRMDDRGVGESGGDASKMTISDYASDISAAIGALDSIFPAGLPKGVLGHSEGGNAAVKTALGDLHCRFIITLAAPAWPGDSVIMSQARAMATAMTGKWDGEAAQRRILELVKSPLPTVALAPTLYSELGRMLGSAAELPQVKKQIQQQVDVLVSPAYRSLVRYNPAEDMRKVAVPWLALNGDKDFQVLPENLSAIAELNPRAQTRLLPGHNHLFLECHSGFPTEYSSLPGDISPETLEAIASWLDELTAAGGISAAR